MLKFSCEDRISDEMERQYAVSHNRRYGDGHDEFHIGSYPTYRTTMTSSTGPGPQRIPRRTHPSVCSTSTMAEEAVTMGWSPSATTPVQTPTSRGVEREQDPATSHTFEGFLCKEPKKEPKGLYPWQVSNEENSREDGVRGRAVSWQEERLRRRYLHGPQLQENFDLAADPSSCEAAVEELCEGLIALKELNPAIEQLRQAVVAQCGKRVPQAVYAALVERWTSGDRHSLLGEPDPQASSLYEVGSLNEPDMLLPPPAISSEAVQYEAHPARRNCGSCIGVDIGGTLAKFVVLETQAEPASANLIQYLHSSYTYGSTGKRERSLAVMDSRSIGGSLHFISFSSERMVQAVQLVKENNLHRDINELYATGGGAHKFKELFEKELGITFISKDELGTVIVGICYMIDMVPNECYTMALNDENKQRLQEQPISGAQSTEVRKWLVKTKTPVTSCKDLFPFLLCNIGTGVSIVRVNSATDFKRVSGTALGGGTFLGLCRLLTEAQTFDDALELSARGDSSKVNMTVGDIYGGRDLNQFGLSAGLTASFFAKNLMNMEANPRTGMQDEDIAEALGKMIAQNITQITHLNARLHGINRVFFTGNFLRHNDTAARTIVEQMNRWATLDTSEQIPVQAMFLQHEGYFGAIGALLKNKETKCRSPKWSVLSEDDRRAAQKKAEQQANATKGDSR